MAPSYLVTLVHGTFAREAAWTEASSTICAELHTRFSESIEFKRFSWTGSNTHLARREAARRLAADLQNDLNAHPEAEHIVIAHSHGGNIALKALQLLKTKKVRTITLGTPFFLVTPRNLQQIFLMFASSFLMISSITLLLILFSSIEAFSDNELGGLIINLYNNISTESSNLEPIYISDTASYYFLIPIILCISIFIWLKCGFFGAENGTEILIGKVFEKLSILVDNRQYALIHDLSARHDAEHDVFSISIVGDEAESYLGIIDRLSRLPILLIRCMMNVSEFSANLVFNINRFNLIAEPIAKIIEKIIGPIIGIILIGIMVLPIILTVMCIPVFLMTFIRRASSWDDSIMDYLIADIKSTNEPHVIWSSENIKSWLDDEPTSNSCTIRHQNISRKNLFWVLKSIRHSSLYEDRTIINDICHWIKTGKTVSPGRKPYPSPEEIAEVKERAVR